MFMTVNFCYLLIVHKKGMGLFVLRDIINDSTLYGLNFTSHCKILRRSALRRSTDETGSSVIKKTGCYHQQTIIYKNLFYL